MDATLWHKLRKTTIYLTLFLKRTEESPVATHSAFLLTGFYFCLPRWHLKSNQFPERITRLINLTFLGPTHLDYLVTFTYRRLFSRKIAMVYENFHTLSQVSVGFCRAVIKEYKDSERETACFHPSCLSLRLYFFTVSTRLFNRCKY